MYPPPRPTSRPSGSAATSTRTNPLRSNNDRDDIDQRRYSAESAVTTQRAIGDSESELSGSQSMDDRSAEQARETQRLNQIIQQFFVKGALTVVSSRINFPQYRTRSGAIKQNKWFNLVLDDAEELSRLTSRWRILDIETGLPKTMTIEFYVDLSEIPKSKSLVLIDEAGKRWDVIENFLATLPSRSRIPNSEGELTEIPLILERWQFSMEDISSRDSRPDADTLSNVYKKGIPIFRSLFSQSRLLPAWKYYRGGNRQGSSHSGAPPLKLKYRILSGAVSTTRKDSLDSMLYPGQKNVVDRYSFGPLQCPAGILHASVVFRSNCDFRIDDSEALLSSHFMRSGDDYFRPSWTGRANSDSNQVAGSAPASKRGQEEDQERSQAYGSLSTFHTIGPKPSSSPISALRAVTDAGSGSPNSPPNKLTPNQRQDHLSRASVRSNEGLPVGQRRPSVSFQPFKAGSLASSPASGMLVPGSPLNQNNRPVAGTSHRSRPSMTTLPQAVLRAPNLQNEFALASSASSSPKPAPINKFSSSFSYRKNRLSLGASREDERSSGKPSPSSSARGVGSDVLNEGRDQASSGSVQQTDDENLQDFLRLLESKKELKSFNRTDAAAKDSQMRKTTAALSKFQRMRESNTVLSDSLSSSLLLNRSSSSSSRQLANVPSMVPGTSVSPASSLGKPISPHTPHTPAIPSRLSANSIIDYTAPTARRSRSRGPARERSAEAVRDEVPAAVVPGDDSTTNAIDIPTSPRPWPYGRSISSVRHQRSNTEEAVEYGPRPYSLPDDRELSLADLSDRPAPLDQAASDEKLDDDPRSSDDPSPEEFGPEPAPHVYSTTADPSSQGLYARRPRGSVSRRTPLFGHSYSPSSSGQAGGSSSTVERFSTPERGGVRGTPSLRNSTALQEEEALIFELSDMDGRRSLEDANERGGFRGARGTPGGWR